MKSLLKNLLVVSCVLVAFSACKHGRLWFSGSSSDTLCVDTFKYIKTDSTAGRLIKVEIEADYPSPITGPLSASVASWIRTSISKNAAPTDTMDGQKVVDFLGKQIFENYESTADDFVNEMDYMATAKLVSKRRNYVSYVLSTYEYTGGAHGMKTVVGRTFSQIDGKQYGWELLKDTAKTGFRKLLKKGARKYFSTDKSRGEITDEELCEMLLLDISGSPVTVQQLDSFPLPSTPPYFTRKGVTFVYQAYEIAPYAAGIPTFTVDFDDIDKYLSDEGKQLLKKKDD